MSVYWWVKVEFKVAEVLDAANIIDHSALQTKWAASTTSQPAVKLIQLGLNMNPVHSGYNTE